MFALLDLYGPTFYPPHQSTAAERFAWAKRNFEQEIGFDKFRMFFAVHEFEAWLLSDPSIFPAGIGKALANKVARPEQINFHEPPTKLLERVYKQQTNRNYKKTTYGKQLFARLDPEVAVGKCPYLKAMLEEMLSLAKAAIENNRPRE